MTYPLFHWLDERGAGVLLHPTSLPGNDGVGTLGAEARRFIEFLSAGGLKYWQMCPLGPTGYGDSPYQCFSAFAGNPYLIDLDALMEFDLLKFDDTRSLRNMPVDQVDYGALYVRKWPVLRLVYRNFCKKKLSYLPNYGYFQDFKEQHASWLDPFALFMAMKENFNGKPWYEWNSSLRSFQKATKSKLAHDLEDSVEAQKFYQYLFFGQWQLLKQFAADSGVQIIGDIPIFTSLDSADVWANPEIFQLTKQGKPSAVAGVPPDYFSPTGQLWGNPLYDWKTLKADGYSWWMDRLKLNFEFFDVVRIDHFRGFESYWRIPAKAKDATKGKWEEGPGIDFFAAIKKCFPEARVIAEDLGEITPKVRELKEQTGFPGMAILQFAFGGKADNPYLPHNLIADSIIYPGTHDNDTTLGWYQDATPETQDQVRRYFSISGEEISWDFLRAAYRSVSRLAIIPMQDLLSLDSEARMNTPGEAAGNWQWRYTKDQLENLHQNSTAYLRELGELYDR